MAGGLVRILADLKETEALQMVEEKLRDNISPASILDEARRAMEVVGERFAKGEYFLPDLVYAGEILKRITEMVKPKLSDGPAVQRIGKCIIGTVAGDIHDIGKNIVVFMLDVNGFEVYDLGIDVPAQKFVDTITETQITVVGLSGFLTLAFDSMKKTIEAIKAAGLRDQVKIMIGGGQIDEVIKDYTGADACGKDAMAAVTLVKRWIGGK